MAKQRGRKEQNNDCSDSCAMSAAEVPFRGYQAPHFNLELPYYDGNYMPDFPVVPLPAAWASDVCEQLTGIRAAVTCLCIDIGCDVIILPNDQPDAAYREYVHIAMWPRRTSDHGADFQDIVCDARSRVARASSRTQAPERDGPGLSSSLAARSKRSCRAVRTGS